MNDKNDGIKVSELNQTHKLILHKQTALLFIDFQLLMQFFFHFLSIFQEANRMDHT